NREVGQSGEVRWHQGGVIRRFGPIFHKSRSANRAILGENRARTYRLAGPRGSEAARPENKYLEIKPDSRGTPLQPVPGVRSASAGCRAVRDSTLVAWYRSLYAPRTGRMTVTIGRRELLAALGGAAAWPLAAWAQPPRSPYDGGRLS